MAKKLSLEKYIKKNINENIIQRIMLCNTMSVSSELELCPDCIKKFPLLELDHKTKGMCKLCNSSDSYDVKYKKGVK